MIIWPAMVLLIGRLIHFILSLTLDPDRTEPSQRIADVIVGTFCVYAIWGLLHK